MPGLISPSVCNYVSRNLIVRINILTRSVPRDYLFNLQVEIEAEGYESVAKLEGTKELKSVDVQTLLERVF